METGGVPEQRVRQPGRGPGVAGLRHVSWVRVTVSGAGARCEAIGIGHRVPVVRRIPLSTASQLIARGVPSVVVRPDHEATNGAEPLPVAASARAEG